MTTTPSRSTCAGCAAPITKNTTTNLDREGTPDMTAAAKTENATFQGKKNIYVCDACKGHIVTVDRDHGVTPFMITCHATLFCKGMMKSSMYRVFDQNIGADYE